MIKNHFLGKHNNNGKMMKIRKAEEETCGRIFWKSCVWENFSFIIILPWKLFLVTMFSLFFCGAKAFPWWVMIVCLLFLSSSLELFFYSFTFRNINDLFTFLINAKKTEINKKSPLNTHRQIFSFSPFQVIFNFHFSNLMQVCLRRV